MSENNYVITVTRQFGSLGRPIAKKISEILGIEYYDRDLVEMTAKDLGLPISKVDEAEESAKKIENPFRMMMFPLGKGTDDTQEEIFASQQNLIELLSKKSSCVIVGRCADFILSDMENAMHVYIYAPYKRRLENSIHDLKLSEEEAERTIQKVDEARISYHEHFTGFRPDDPNHKDIMIDSSLLGVDGTADLLADAARRRFRL